jgi:exodeoxyribonuclease V alpha subunit
MRFTMFYKNLLEFYPEFVELLKKTSAGNFGIPISLDLQKQKNLPKGLVYNENTLYIERFFHQKMVLEDLAQKRNKACVEKLLMISPPDVLLNEAQKEATKAIFNEATLLLQGGPGSGKTFTISRLIPIFIKAFEHKFKRKPRILLAAQTAKAVHHLAKQIPTDFQPLIRVETLHKALKISKQIRSIEPCVIDEDLVIVDESSMIDADMMNLFLQSLELRSRLILVGDPYQLPPIEGGAPFKFLIEKKAFCHHFLPGSLRAENKQIIEDANALFLGKAPYCFSIEQFDLNLSIEKFPQPHDATAPIQHLQQYKILSSLKVGPFGSQKISQDIFNLLKTKKGRYLHVPIMITQNNEKMSLFNGQEGVMIYDKFKEVHHVFFPHLSEPVPSPLLPPHEISYAISIHKSQGSEYSYVDILLPESKEPILKEHLYTAMTRAKKGLQIFDQNMISSLF